VSCQANLEHDFVGGLAPEVRELTTPGEMAAACGLYRRVFRYAGKDDGINPRLLTSLHLHGGAVVGAVTDHGDVLALAFGFGAVETDPADPHVYHFSQAAVVDPALQGARLGRALKHAQREVAQRRGATRMRWTFDPLVSRNAHFNLDVLGARGRWYHRDLHGAAHTDRITVEWDFVPSRTDLPWQAPSSIGVGEVVEDDGGVYLGIPADPRAVKGSDRQPFLDLFDGLFVRGLVAAGCRRIEPHVAVYRFTTSADGVHRGR
jgi:predicted GNAT superfamily acetyltransferase